MAPQISGSLARIQPASQADAKASIVSRTPRTRNPSAVTPPTPPNGGSPVVRRSSSQLIAGRSGRPASSVTTTVPRWVVSVTPARAAVRTAGSASTRRQASPTAVQKISGSCSAQPGCGTRYGVNGTRAAATMDPSGPITSARALCVPTSMATTWSPLTAGSRRRGRPCPCRRSRRRAGRRGASARPGRRPPARREGRLRRAARVRRPPTAGGRCPRRAGG